MNYKLTLEKHPTIVEAFASIPNDATSLDLSGNDMGSVLKVWLVSMSNVRIRPNITSIDLSCNRLHALSVESHQIFMSSLVRVFPNFTSLNLSMNNLFRMSNDELKAMMRPIQKSFLQKLNLSRNRLDQMCIYSYSIIMNAMPPSFCLLDLSSNCLQSMLVGHFALMLRYVPPSVDTLILSENSLGKRNILFLNIIMDSIPTTVKKLDLSVNFLQEQNKDDFTKIIGALHSDISFLNLAGNHLWRASVFDYREIDSSVQGAENLCEILHSITTQRPRLNSIDLSQNGLDHLSFDKLKTILHSIAEHIKLIILQNNRLLLKKTHSEIDEFISGLGDVNFRKRLDLSLNGEPEVARAIVPLTQMSIFGIPRSQKNQPNIYISSDNIMSIGKFLQSNLPVTQTIESIENVSCLVERRLETEISNRKSPLDETNQTEDASSKYQKTL